MGILDAALQRDDSMDPQSQGILQAAFALLAASGATRTPTSIGEALGHAGLAGVGAYEAAKKAETAQAIQKMQAAKMAADLKMQEDITGAGGPEGLLSLTDPAKMRAVGMKLALAGHSGGAALVAQADKIEKQKMDDERLASMKSGENQPGLFGS